MRLDDPNWRCLHWHRPGREPLALDLRALPVDQIHIEDIAATLAQINRWGGRVPVPYNVARHSLDTLACARDAGEPRWVQYECLMHDATEAIIGDIPSPVKDLFPEIREFEASVRRQLAPRFLLRSFEPQIVKHYDNVAAETELEYVRSPHARAEDWRESRDRFVFWYNRLAWPGAPR